MHASPLRLAAQRRELGRGRVLSEVERRREARIEERPCQAPYRGGGGPRRAEPKACPARLRARCRHSAAAAGRRHRRVEREPEVKVHERGLRIAPLRAGGGGGASASGQPETAAPTAASTDSGSHVEERVELVLRRGAVPAVVGALGRARAARPRDRFAGRRSARDLGHRAARGQQPGPRRSPPTHQRRAHRDAGRREGDDADDQPDPGA